MCSRYRYSNYYVFMVETVKSDVILLAYGIGICDEPDSIWSWPSSAGGPVALDSRLEFVFYRQHGKVAGWSKA